MRLFVAVDVPQAVKDAIETQVVGPLRDALPGARWTRPEGRHLTLEFLGEVAEDRISEVTLALGTVRGPAFEAAFAEVGAFPNLRRPRVLWTGIGEGREALVALAAAVQEALGPLGFEAEDRPFHPHLTLARFPKPQVIGSVPQVDVPSVPFEVTEIVLFSSRLHPQGARYTPVGGFEIAR